MTSLKGFIFRGYRSFPSNRPTTLFPLRKINLVAGQNNTGKSNVLRVIADTYGTEAGSPSPWDRPLGEAEHAFARAEMHRVDDVLAWAKTRPLPSAQIDQIDAFLRLPGIASDSCADFIEIGVTGQNGLDQEALRRAAQRSGNHQLARALSMSLTSTGGGGAGDDAYRVLSWLLQLRPHSPSAFTVSGTRTISDDSSQAPDLNGLSIKRRLLELQNPSTDRLKDKELFARVQEFVRAVMDDSTITIDIPHDLSTIHVTQGGHTLPIENVGTGVHEVVIIAAAATVTQNSILCIEEPEVHLHPVLQRKLLRYLESSTSNQYFIATHSAHMLDSQIGSIFHVTRADGISSVRYAGAARDKSAVCADLGYRPSDLVQTNAVLWVEGPKQRVIADLGKDPSTGMAWVTAGYTVENYVPEQVLTNAIRAAHPSIKKRGLTNQDRWTNPLTTDRLGIKQPSKVSISKIATMNWSHEWPFDLKKRVQEVISLIEAANSHT